MPHGESTGQCSRQKALLEQKQEGFWLPLARDPKNVDVGHNYKLKKLAAVKAAGNIVGTAPQFFDLKEN